MKNEKLRTVKEAARRWSVSLDRAYQLLDEWEVMTVRVGRNQRFIRISESEIERVRKGREIPEYTEAAPAA